RISLGGHLDPAVLADGLAEDRVMGLQDRSEAIAEPPDELRRSLDVGEQEGDSPDGQRRHLSRSVRGRPGGGRRPGPFQARSRSNGTLNQFLLRTGWWPSSVRVRRRPRWPA